MPEDGLVIFLILQLLASIAAAIAWFVAARGEKPSDLKIAAYVTGAWFAVLAGAIAYLFDTDMISFSQFD